MIIFKEKKIKILRDSINNDNDNYNENNYDANKNIWEIIVN